MNNLNVIIENTAWNKCPFDVSEKAVAIFEKTLDFVRQNEVLNFLEMGKDIIINLSLSNDSEVHKLNKEFRGFDKATNVLSFANIDDEDFDNYIKISPEIELGDIIIAFETLTHEADEKKIPLVDHFSHLLTHGILHLLGYDHQEDEDAEEMEDFEVSILQQFNINNPYQE